MILAIVCPCYNEQEILQSSVTKLLAELDGLIHAGHIASGSFLCLIDDGSTDKTWMLTEQLCEQHTAVFGLKLSKNFGHQSAILAGMLSVKERADAVVTLDVDLQDDISVLKDFVLAYQAGADIVFGIRNDRTTDTFFKRFTAQFYYKMLGFLGVDIVYNHADYRLVSKKALEVLENYRENNLFLRGIFKNLGFTTAEVFYKRLDRQAGTSKFTFFKMLGFAFEGITSFSVKPLRLITVLGFIALIGTFFIAGWGIYTALIGKTVPGWASLVVTICFFSSVQLIFLGVIGEYVGKIYKEVKDRPRFIVDKKLFKQF